MDGVAAEVTQEISVLLEHHHLDAGAGEQITQHHAGGSTSGDAAACGDGFSWHASDYRLRRHPFASAMASR
jgi:hypothetical protein